MSNEDLNPDEKYIVLSAIKCLHNLKYIADLAIIGQKHNDIQKERNEILIQIFEELVRVREIMEQ